MLNILFCCSTVLYADRYMFQEVQGILCSPTNWYSSPREPRLGKQLQFQLGVERDCPYLLLWGIKLNTKNTLIVCVPLGRERGSHMENQRIAGLFKEPPPEDLSPKKE